MFKSAIKLLFDNGISRKVNRALEMSNEYVDTKFPQYLAQSITELCNERKMTESQKYELLYEINRELIPDFAMADYGRIMLRDSDFRSYFNHFSLGNWKNFERRWNVVEFLKTLASVEGNFAECGVYQGATAFQMCKFAELSGREVHLFDSFEGLSEPNENDGSFWTSGNLTASEETVHLNLEGFTCYKTFKGWIPDAFPLDTYSKYAFLHIDVDLEQPTYDSMEFFYPRLSKGAVVLLDDHGYDTCPGARKAVLEFMADKPESVVDLSSGQGLIIKH